MEQEKTILMVEQNYTTQETSELIQHVDQQNVRINHYKPLQRDIWETIQKKLKIDWTYDSNAIEGCALTRGETNFFLQEGLTVAGKPLKDFLDARNHAEAIDWLYQIVKDQRPISEGIIKEFNALLLSGITYTKAIDQQHRTVKKPATPGKYKKLPNHVLQQDGTIHHYTDPLQTPTEMEKLTQWINHNINLVHPTITSAIAHYNMVRIHPFDDGNGRGARLLMNLILIKKGFTPAIIRMEQREEYLQTLQLADQKNLNPFIEFVIQSLIHTQASILEILKKA